MPIKGICAQCEEHHVPIRRCVMRTLGLDIWTRMTKSIWRKYLVQVTGDKAGCFYCHRLPAIHWTVCKCGCNCTQRVCRKCLKRKGAQCHCPDSHISAGRGSPGEEPSPWQENAVRHLEGD